MTPDHIRRLVGGYATGTLSETQRKLLFEAALEDQELFDELARDQALKELLEAPGVRQRLVANIETRPQTNWWRYPLPWALGGAALSISAGLMALVFLTPSGSRLRPSGPTEVAQARPPVPAEAPSSQSDTQMPPKLQNEPRATRPVQPAAAPSPAAPAAETASGNRVASPPPELQNEPKPDVLGSKQETAAPQKDAAGQPALQQTAAGPAREAVETSKAAGGGGGGAAASPAAAAAPAPAPPPAAVARNGAIGAVPGVSATRALAARVPPPPARFSFDYSIHDGVLRIVPGSDGYLLVRAVVGPIDRLVLSTAHVVRATPAELRVPDGAASMVVLFSTRPVQEDSTDDLAARASPRTEQSGTVEDPRPSVNSRLEVRIVVSGK
jgi:hypothetical protein